jgi:hypothetical protein
MMTTLSDLPIEQLRRIQPTFSTLTELRGSEALARLALIEENIFVRAHPEFNFGKEFASRARSYLLEHCLEWTQDNLLAAARNVSIENN